MAPTYDIETAFSRDWKGLSAAQKQDFHVAYRQLKADIAAANSRPIQFHPSLRIKGVQGRSGVFEMTWAPDGRATFEFGPEQRSGKVHIVWRRIGTHDILSRP